MCVCFAAADLKLQVWSDMRSSCLAEGLAAPPLPATTQQQQQSQQQARGEAERRGCVLLLQRVMARLREDELVVVVAQQRAIGGGDRVLSDVRIEELARFDAHCTNVLRSRRHGH